MNLGRLRARTLRERVVLLLLPVGHEYAPADYIEAWLALAEPEGWTPAEVERLRSMFE